MAASVCCGCSGSATMACTNVLNYVARCPSAVLRSAVAVRAVAAPTRPVKSAVPELLDDRLAEQASLNFQDYTQATQMLDRIKGRESDLEVLLNQLNAFEASLDDTLLAPPVVDEAAERAARQAKRAAKRAERKAKATAEAVSGSLGMPTAPEPTSTRAHLSTSSSTRNLETSSQSTVLSAGLPANLNTSAASSSAVSDVMQLEELFKLTFEEPAPAPTPKPAPTVSSSPSASSTPASKASPASFTPSRTSAPSTSTSAPTSILRPRKASKKPAAPAAPAAAATAASAPAAPSAPTQIKSPALLEELEMLLPPLAKPHKATPSRPPKAAAPAPLSVPSRGRKAPPPKEDEQVAATHAAVDNTHDLSMAAFLEAGRGGQAQGEEEDVEDPAQRHAGPSDDDLRQLQAEMYDDDDPDPSASQQGRPQHSVLEQSAMAPRAGQQASSHTRPSSSSSATHLGPSLPSGPSLLSLVPSSAAPAARVRQARRSARYGHGSAAGGGSLTAAGGRGTKSQDGTVQFLSSSTSANVLGVEAEKEVVEVCRDFLFLEKVRRQCQKTLHRRPTTEELAAAVGMDILSFLKRQEAGLTAKEVLLKSNYRLVMMVCRKHLRQGMQLQDLVAEGVKGLLRGAEMFDASKGFRFCTYAHWWIRQAISRSMAVTGRAVRLPLNMIEQLTKIRAASALLANRLMREPSLAEISAEVGISVPRIELLLEAARANTSMDTAMGDDQGQTVKDTLQDDRGAADEEFGSSSLRKDIDAMLETLPPREARVLRLRFGLEDGKDWTLEEVGDSLGVTRERIRQLEAKALRRLRVKSLDENGKLRDYSENLSLLEEKDLAARTSSGTRKT